MQIYPKTLNEIMKSEEKYLTLYEKNPIATDIRYFIKCIYNILFKGAKKLLNHFNSKFRYNYYLSSIAPISHIPF